ncbi:MAG: GMC family oxidoreductase [Cyanobacteria bacterium RM1_2_2]|nr:GMC family oxidoreductase [Cyanobacteria bacterium RM1_2_2]
MIIDGRTVTNNETITTDICIVGAGPAGISLAREFVNQDFRVCLLESGGLETLDRSTQSLGEAEIAGEMVQIAPENRHRQFGGNSGYWGVHLSQTRQGVRLVPLDEVDFEQRDWVPYSGWPFNREHLVPFYERAQTVMGSGPFAYDAEDWETTDAPQMQFKSDRLQTRMFQFGVGNLFIDQYRREIGRANNITTLFYANALELETDETGAKIERVKVGCVDGNRFWVAAKLVILAAGGVENTHLLLLSNQTHPAGVGNQRDLVGRFFMDHPLVHGGMIVPFNPQIFNRTALYDLREVNGTAIMGGLTLSNAAMRREKLLNIAAWIFPRARRCLPAGSRSSLKPSRNSIMTQQLDRGVTKLLQDVGNMAEEVGNLATLVRDKVAKKPMPYWATLADGGWSYLQADKERQYDLFEVLHITEQVPDPNNRLVLGEGTDLLGRQRIKHLSRWSQADKNGIQRAWQILSEELRQAGIGKFVPQMDGDDFIVASATASHHMGTTRMHIDPKQGVVDEHCKVHGVSNLFIASSSVFPTGGYANPTLTIVALALRLADRVKLIMSNRL